MQYIKMERRELLDSEETWQIHLSQKMGAKINSHKSCWHMYIWCDLIKWALDLCGFPPNNPFPQSYEKNIRKIPTLRHPPKYWPILNKNTEYWRKCHIQEGSKETWQLHIMRYLGYDRRAEKGHYVKIKNF